MLLNRWLGEISQWAIIVVVVVDVVVIGINDRLVLEIRIFGGNFSNIVVVVVVVVVVEEKVVVDESIVAFPLVVDVVNFLTLKRISFVLLKNFILSDCIIFIFIIILAT
jgi:hypothetical protein